VAKDKSKVDPEETAEGLEDNINSLAASLEKLTSQISPLMDFTDISKEIDSLKKTIPNMGKDGETCAHGNSWHSGCSECESMTELDVVFALVEEFPNDAELGFKVREMYNLYNDSDNTED
jgi:hypothetical protein